MLLRNESCAPGPKGFGARGRPGVMSALREARVTRRVPVSRGDNDDDEGVSELLQW
jgi:hypothetical protein